MPKDWYSPTEVPTRRAFGFHTDVTGRQGPENPTVHSKDDRRHPEGLAGATHSSHGEAPAGVYVDAVNPDSPITHHAAPFQHYVETVGHHPRRGGEYIHPTHPNSERRAAGNAVFTSAPLQPVGMTHSKTGGAHGQEPTRPESRGTHPGQEHRQFRDNSLDKEPQRRGKTSLKG